MLEDKASNTGPLPGARACLVNLSIFINNSQIVMLPCHPTCCNYRRKLVTWFVRAMFDSGMLIRHISFCRDVMSRDDITQFSNRGLVFWFQNACIFCALLSQKVNKLLCREIIISGSVNLTMSTPNLSFFCGWFSH